jgi:hypothetical protein
MIPTRSKAKLPRTLSYPIGAEALTEGLGDAPHGEAFTVAFLGKPVWPGSEFQQLLAEEHPYKVLVASYQPARRPGYVGPRFLVERGWFEPKWELTVYPVVRQLRHLTNHLLRREGLPLVVRWLRSSQEVGWTERDHRIELVFDPAGQSLSAEEASGV